MLREVLGPAARFNVRAGPCLSDTEAQVLGLSSGHSRVVCAHIRLVESDACFVVTSADLAPEQRRALALHPERPAVRDLMGGVCNKFMELHFPGSDDDDSGFCCGVGDLNGVNVMLIGWGPRLYEAEPAHARI